MSPTRQPDILLIVLDCVRAQDYLGGENPVPGLAGAESLAREGVVYKRAVAPASWTLPSHASMFTEFYPWESGVYGSESNARFLRGSTLAESLRSMGYQTASFSANPWISPESGLDKGFDIKYWGRFADCYLRNLTRWVSSAHAANPANDMPQLSERLSKSNRLTIGRTIRRFPLLADITTRLISRALSAGSESRSRVAPWIEPAVEGWLNAASRDRPVFGYVNLLDAHEPFVGLPERIEDFASWLDPLLVSQRERDRAGRLVPMEARDGARLRKLYRMSIGIVDARLGAIVRMFQSVRDWDNTCVVVTSDHGQALGEQSRFFHARGGPDSIHRVPLIVKPVHGRGGPGVNLSWTTLTLLPSIVGAASIGELPHGTPRFVSHEVGGEDSRPSIVLSLADNTEARSTLSSNNGHLSFAAGSAIVGYSEDYKVVIDTESQMMRAFVISKNDASRSESLDVGDKRLSNLKAAATRAASQMRESDTNRASQITMQHLREWGYE